MASQLENEKELIDIYKKAEQGIRDTITKTPKKQGSKIAYQKALLADVNKEISRLQIDSVDWVEDVIPETYIKAVKVQKIQTGELATKFYDVTQKDFIKINRAAIKSLTNNTVAQLSIANVSLQKNIQDVLQQKFAQGLTLTETKNLITEQLYGINGTGKLTINGRHYDPSKYAGMIATTNTNRAVSEATASSAKFVKSKTFEMSSHSPTCNICSPLQGRWYSDGEGDYPNIHEHPWKSGFKIVHPHCKHRYAVVILDLATPEEIEKQKENSNRKFVDIGTSKKSVNDAINKFSAKDIGQSKQHLEKYFRQQNKQIVQWNDAQQYQRYQDRLGKDEVPKSYAGFRRMKYANNQDNYEALQEDYRATGVQLKQLSQTIVPTGTRRRSTNINDATSISELNQTMKFKSRGTPLEHVNFDNKTNLETMKIQMIEYDRLNKKYNSLGIEVKNGSLNPLVAAGVSGSEEQKILTYSNALFKNDAKSVKRIMQNGMEAGFNATTDIKNISKSVTTHEFAHTIKTFKKPTKDLEFIKEIKSVRRRYNKEILSIDKKWKDGTISTIEKNGLLSDIYISDYSKESVDEFFAESFTNAELNHDPSPFAKEVQDITLKFFGK